MLDGWMDGPLGTKTLSFPSLSLHMWRVGQLYESRYAFILRDRRRHHHQPSA